jgi:hypothetical protein
VLTRNLAVAGSTLLLACQPLNDLDAATRGAPTTAGVGETPVATEETRPDDSSRPATPPGPATDSPTAVVAPVPAGPTTEAPGSSAPSQGPAETTSAPISSSEGSGESFTTDGISETTAEGTSVDATLATSTAISSESPTSDEPPVCDEQCALGDECTAFSTCLSLRCDEVCEPMQFRVDSDGLDAVSTSVKVHVELYADPSVPVAWEDLAVLYFITVEKRDDFVLNFAEGGGTALPMQVGLTDWIVVWTTDAAGNVPSTVTPFDVQFRSDPWLPDTPESNDNSNDYSYRDGMGANDKIVLCRKVNNTWKHVQGTPPSNVAEPCQYVDNCEDALDCDPL